MEDAKGTVVSTRTGLPFSAGQPSIFPLRYVQMHTAQSITLTVHARSIT